MMPNPFGAWRASLVDELSAGGLPATLNPAASPPMVLVDVCRVIGAQGVGGWSVVADVHVVVPAGAADALAVERLESMLAVALAVLGASNAEPSVYADTDCPSYAISVTATVPNPHC